MPVGDVQHVDGPVPRFVGARRTRAACRRAPTSGRTSRSRSRAARASRSPASACEPSMSATKIAGWPSAVRRNAISVPSGDHGPDGLRRRRTRQRCRRAAGHVVGDKRRRAHERWRGGCRRLVRRCVARARLPRRSPPPGRPRRRRRPPCAGRCARRRWRRSCSCHASRSGSVLFVTISKISFSSAMGASCISEYGTALRRERADGRRTDAHDPCGVLGSVAVQVEQDEGGPLPRREGQEHPTNVFADVDIVVRVAHDTDRNRTPRGPTSGARPHLRPVQRDAEEVRPAGPRSCRSGPSAPTASGTHPASGRRPPRDRR